MSHWHLFNPTATFLGNRRGWPTYALPNGVRVILGPGVERNIVGDANFEAAVATMPCRKIALSLWRDVGDFCARGGHRLFPVQLS